MRWKGLAFGKLRTFALITLSSLAFSREVCLKVKAKEPYLRLSLYKLFERIYLYRGYELSCTQGSEVVRVLVKRYEKLPLSYDRYGRVSEYALILELEFKGKTLRVSTFTKYRRGYGSLSFRKSLEELLKKLELLINSEFPQSSTLLPSLS